MPSRSPPRNKKPSKTPPRKGAVGKDMIKISAKEAQVLHQTMNSIPKEQVIQVVETTPIPNKQKEAIYKFLMRSGKFVKPIVIPAAAFYVFRVVCGNLTANPTMKELCSHGLSIATTNNDVMRLMNAVGIFNAIGLIK